jgi:hypothetical protein
MSGYTTENPTPSLRPAEAITDGDGPTMGRVTFDAYVTEAQVNYPVHQFGTSIVRGGPPVVMLWISPIDPVTGPLINKRIRIEVLDDE